MQAQIRTPGAFNIYYQGQSRAVHVIQYTCIIRHAVFYLVPTVQYRKAIIGPYIGVSGPEWSLYCTRTAVQLTVPAPLTLLQ
jgi:hypothetical protein